MFVYTILIAFSATSFAGEYGNGGGTNADANSSSGSLSQQQQGQITSQSFTDGRTYNSTVKASDLGKMVPNVMAPSLTTTLTETCMGSTSFGGSGSGFGFSFGTTWRDSACVRRLDARQLAAFQDMGTAREIMCASSIVREAAKRAGRPCVEDGGLPAYQLAVPAPAPVAQVDTSTVTVEDAAAVKRVDEAKGPLYRAEDPS